MIFDVTYLISLNKCFKILSIYRLIIVYGVSMIHFFKNYTFYSTFLPRHLILQYDQIGPSLEAVHFLKDSCVRFFPPTHYGRGAMFRSFCESSVW